MKTRRTFLALGASTLMASTAGCIGSIPSVGDEAMTFEAEAASVAQSAVDDTGYDEQDVDDVMIERTFEAAGQRQDVIVTNWQAEYDKSVDLGELGVLTDDRVRAAVFTALSTPRVSVLDRTFNPVADMSSEELAEMVQDRYDGLDNLEHVGEETMTIAGESTTVGELEGEGTLADAGETIDLILHIAEAVESGDDLVIGVGGYPTHLREDERPDVFSMMEAIEHDG